MTHTDFELKKPFRTEIREDGTKHHFPEAEPCDMFISGDVNIISAGTVDYKRERLDKQEHLGFLIDKHRHSDAALDQMLESYNKAVKDPGNELVHLYEIRDSLSERF